MKYPSILGTLLISAVLSLCFTACSDDDDSGAISADFVGTWFCSEYYDEEDEELHTTSRYYVLTEEGEFKEYFNRSDYNNDRGYYSGKWSVSGNKFIMRSEYYHRSDSEVFADADTETYEIKEVKEDKLALYDTHYKETWYWNRLN